MRLGSSTRWHTSALAAGFLALAACGGGSGGGGGGGSLGTASVKGVVVTRDGTTANLAGIRITNPRTGAFDVTDATGAFDLGLLPAGTITLRVSDALASVLPLSQGADDPPGDDQGGDVGGQGADDPADHDLNDDHGDDADTDGFDDGDDHDVGDDDADVVGISDGESVEVHLSVHDGQIETFDVSHSGLSEREGEIRLKRSVDSDDLDVSGEAKLESRSDREKLQVEAEHLTPDRTVEAFVLLPDASAEESLGVRAAGLTGKVEWELDTHDGAVLPFGVLTVAELEGYGVEVRDATTGAILLFGTLGSLPHGTEDGGGDTTESRGRALLTPALGVTGEAHVDIESKTEEAKEEFKAEIEGQASGLGVEVWLEDPSNLGTLTLVGSFTVGGEGEGRLELDTHEGDPLPYGVAGVSALVGMQIELRNAAGGAVLFSGLVPSLVLDD